MPRLIIRSGVLAHQELALNHGTNQVGRAEGNDLCIPEPSVSSSHCHIVVGEEAVTIIDLNSTNGTFVNQEPVQSARLKAGDAVQFGNVECVFVAETPVARPTVRIAIPKSAAEPPPVGVPPPPAIRVAALVGLPPEPPRIAPPLPPPVAAPGVPGAAWCKNHPKSPALYYCTKCQKAFCELCVAVRHAGHLPTHNCRLCASDCALLAATVGVPEEQSFLAQLPRAFSYPFKGNGVILLVAGTAFFLFLSFIQQLAGRLGPYGWVAAGIVAVSAVGYLFSYAKIIITSSAAGEAAPPDWPEAGDWREDIVIPFGQLVALAALTFGPAMILRWWQPGSDAFARTVTLTAVGMGALLAPMGMLALAMFDSVAALNPVALVWSIMRVPLHYLVAAAAFELVIGAHLLAENLGGMLLPVPLLPSVISGFLNLYLIVAGMRILGLLYWTKKDKLSWFSR
jgi:hypothetical protein